MRIFFFFSLLFASFGCLACSPAKAQPAPDYRSVTLASELPTGDAAVDSVPVDYYPAQTSASKASGAVSPTIIVLPPLGYDAHDPLMRRLALFAAHNGVNAALMTLPYHGSRSPKKDGHTFAALYFLSGDSERAAQAFAQSASDVTTVVSWLENQPGVDKTRISLVGISLGAVVAHLVMGRDDRINSGVAFLGAGDNYDLGQHGFFSRLIQFLHPSQRVPRDMDKAQTERILHRVDPLSYADANRPRRVFMVQGARDIVIPPRDATELWNALGRPPIRWVDGNHASLRLATNAAFHAALEYLQSVWAAPTVAAAAAVPTPQLTVPTITFGFVGQTHGRDSLGITPALTDQFFSVGTFASHLPVAHVDGGVTGRGFFVGAAFTLNSYFDLGYATRISQFSHAPSTPRPYLGMHIAF